MPYMENLNSKLSTVFNLHLQCKYVGKMFQLTLFLDVKTFVYCTIFPSKMLYSAITPLKPYTCFNIFLPCACLFTWHDPFPQVMIADDGPESTSLNQLAKAKFDFDGKSEKELSFRKVATAIRHFRYVQQLGVRFDLGECLFPNPVLDLLITIFQPAHCREIF